MDDFIIFIKFSGWIVVIWVRLAKVIEKKGLKVLEEGPITKMKYIITINK